MSNIHVTGEILLPVGTNLLDSAVAHVQLLDTSLADASSAIVAEQTIGDIAGKIDRAERINFTLRSEIQNPHASYSVSIHIDVNGDGRVSIGDYVNAQSYPVVTFGYPNHIKVKTVKVK